MLANAALVAPLALRAVRVWQLCLDFRDGYAIFSDGMEPCPVVENCVQRGSVINVPQMTIAR